MDRERCRERGRWTGTERFGWMRRKLPARRRIRQWRGDERNREGKISYELRERREYNSMMQGSSLT